MVLWLWIRMSVLLLIKYVLIMTVDLMHEYLFEWAEYKETSESAPHHVLTVTLWRTIARRTGLRQRSGGIVYCSPPQASQPVDPQP